MKDNYRRFFSKNNLIFNSGMVFSAGFIGALFLFASNLMLSRVFGPEAFGNYKTIIPLFMFVAALVDFGAMPTLTKYIAEFVARKETGKINNLIWFFLKVKGLSIVSVVMVIYAARDTFAQMFLGDAALSYLIVPGLMLSLFILFDITKPIVAGFQNFKLFSFSGFLTNASIGAATVALGYFFGVYYAILGWVVGYFVGNLPNIWFILKEKYLCKNKAKVDITQIFRRYSLPMHGIYLLNVSNLLIIPVLSLFFAQELIGYYAFAWIFYSGIMLIPIALAQVLFPKVSEMHAQGKNTKSVLRGVLCAYSLVVFIGIGVIQLFSAHIIAFVSYDYISGLLIFKWLNCAGLLLGYLLIYAHYLSAKSEVRKAAWVFFVMNVALFLVSFWVMQTV